MFNSHKQTFGEPQGAVSDILVEMSSELFSEFDYIASIDENASVFKAKLDELIANKWVNVEGETHELVWNNNAKAHIMNLSFHNANENFYELEDAGVIDDCYATQNDFLEAMEQALKQV